MTYSARDRRTAARVLRTAHRILLHEEDPFPVLEAARRVGVNTNNDNPAWALVTQARETVGGQRDEHQLTAAAALVERAWSPDEAPSTKLSRVPRCRVNVPGGRCGRPIGHDPRCSLDPSPHDLVRSIGTDHVLVGGPPTATSMIVAWATTADGNNLRVRRDDHGRGLWIDTPSGDDAPLLLGWAEIRRLALDLNLELADQRGMTPPSPRRVSQEAQKAKGQTTLQAAPHTRRARRADRART